MKVSEMTNRQLQEAIAKQQGIKIVKRDDKWFLMFPDGTFRDLGGQGVSQETIYMMAYKHFVPNWPQDIDAALRDLAMEGRLVLRPSLVAQRWIVCKLKGVRLSKKSLDVWPDVWVEHESLARAIAEAYYTLYCE